MSHICVPFVLWIQSLMSTCFSMCLLAVHWQAFAGRVARNPPSPIMTSIDYILQPHVNRSKDQTIILKLLLQLITYAIWRERNARIFSNITFSTDCHQTLVNRTMRNKLISFPSRDSNSSSLFKFYFGCISYPKIEIKTISILLDSNYGLVHMVSCKGKFRCAFSSM